MTDAEKLRLLADWFDTTWRSSADVFNNEVQVDLRRIATQLELMTFALERLQEWDMLTLSEDGHGVIADAPWARQLIAEALEAS